MTTHITEARLEELRAAGDAVPVRYVGTANGRVIEKNAANELAQSYAWYDHEGHVTDIAAVDLEHILTIPGDEFEVVEPGAKKR